MTTLLPDSSQDHRGVPRERVCAAERSRSKTARRVAYAVVAWTIAITTSAHAQSSDEGKLTRTFPSAATRFGDAVAIEGDTAVVAGFAFTGGPLSESVFVFVRTSSEENTWTQVATLQVRTSNPSVDIDGDTVIVGDVNAGSGDGVAYIFERNHGGPNAWGEVARLTPPAPVAAWFGSSVVVSGDTAVVGDIENSPPLQGPGSVYIFERNRGGPNAWGEAQRLRASDGEGGTLGGSGDQFGAAVAIDGGVILVGAPSDRFVGPGGSTMFQVGSAYAFTRDPGSGTWQESAKLTAADGGPSDAFGLSVRVEGNRAIIGAPGAQPSDLGAAYIFERQDGAWREAAKLQPRTTQRSPGGQSFGRSVALSGDVAAGGAPEDSETGAPRSRSGSAYVFLRDSGGTWNQMLKLTASDGAPGDAFGNSVALSSLTLIVGAPTLSISLPGAAYVCQLDSVTTTSTGCRRQIPDVGGLVTMSGVTTSCCDSSQFVITATFTNTSQVSIAGFFFEVGQLTGGNLLLNADGGPGGVRATLTPDAGDGTLSPGESVTTEFVIGLSSQARFSFWVYPRGEPQP